MIDKKKIKKKSKLSKDKIATLFAGKLLTEIMCRELFGKSPVRLLYDLYGEKWEREGFKFHFEDEKLFDEIYKQIKKEK